MHIHLGLAEFVVFALYLILAMFFLRMLAIRTASTRFGKALATIVM